MNKRVTLAFITFGLLAMAASTTGPLPTISRVEAQTAFGAQRTPALEIDRSNNLYLFSSTATLPAGAGRPGSQIFLTTSKNGGVNWDNFPLTRNLSKSPGEAFGPSVAINKKGKTRIYVTYHDNQDGPTQVYFIQPKKGTKFRRPRNITTHNGGAFSPRVALDSSEAVNIVWGDIPTGQKQVVFVRSTDLGASFSAPLNVSRSSGDAFDPEIAIDPGDNINVAWEDTTPGVSVIMFARSTDRGETFSTPSRVSTGEGRAIEAHVFTNSAGHIFLTWVDESEGDRQAYFSRSTDGGATFSEPINVSQKPGAEISKPVITASGDTVYVAFQNDRRGDKQVFLTKSTNGGVSFSNPVQVSRSNNDVSGGRAHSPAIVIDGRGVLHVAWIDSSVIGADEGLVIYANTNNGQRFSQHIVILSVL
ncbi:MAG TPA: sialidase family protein [Blastocatellia bacterium]|nr:sialidase family protein [Blastocatellia bacterium]